MVWDSQSIFVARGEGIGVGLGGGLGGGGETRRKPNPRRKQDQLPLFGCCCCSLVGCRSAHVRKVSVDSCETTFLDFSRLFSFPIIYLFSKFHLLTSSHALSLSLSLSPSLPPPPPSSHCLTQTLASLSFPSLLARHHPNLRDLGEPDRVVRCRFGFWCLRLSVAAQSALHSSQIDQKPEQLLYLSTFIAAGCQCQIEGSTVNLGLTDELLLLYYA